MPTFCIVDPCLVDFVGHHYEYDRATAAAAAKLSFRPVILSHKKVVEEIKSGGDVRPTFSRTIWESDPAHRDDPDRNIQSCNRIFLQELMQEYQRLGLGVSDVVFGHMITERQLLGWAWFAEQVARRKGPKIVLLLRYQASFYSGNQSSKAFRILERAAKKGSIRLVSDSTRLAQQIERLTELPVDEVAIPHTTDLSETPQPPARGPRLRVVSLGNARDEKGFLEILDAVRILHEECVDDAFEFVLQANDAQPNVQAAIDAFDQLKLPNVTLLREALNTTDYRQLLLSSDLVLVPYWRSIYQARTSGVFLEAVAAGKPVICTDDCWMSDQLEIAGAAVKCRDRDSADLVRALREAAENYAALLEQATATRTNYLRRHNAERLIHELVDGVEPRAADRRPRIAILYPWGDALSGRAGASVRLNLLVDYLAEKGAEIRVLQAGRDEGRKGARVKVEAYETEPPQLERKRHALERFLKRIGVSPEGVHHLWWHLSVRWNAGFRRRLREIIRWSDVVVLEYTFWAAVVSSICREFGKNYVLTDHDIVSDQIRSRPLRWITRRFEFKALAEATHAVMVASDDQARLESNGIRSTLIPNPVDTQWCSEKLPFDTAAVLESLYDLPVRGADVCLFVGSAHGPNRIAADRIRKFASDYRKLAPDSGALFVVAGGCAEPSRQDNFLAVGRVDEFVLHALYEQAKIVLIPLPFGTGASLKTVEAFAACKAVIGTNVAFRGLAVRSGKECIIEEDMTAYPRLIAELLREPDRGVGLGEAAREFASNYDYRVVFAKYPSLLGVTFPETSAPVRARTLSLKIISTARLLASRAIGRKAWREAEGFSRLVLEENPDDANMNFVLGEILTQRNPPDSAALGFYDRAQSNGHDVFSTQLARSRLLRQLGQMAAADAAENQAIRASVDASQFDSELTAVRERAWELFKSEQIELALKLCRETHKLLPGFQHADTHYILALCVQNLGLDLHEALLHFDKALELGFDEFWVRVHRGNVKQALGDPQGAEKDFVRAIELQPDNRSARDALHSTRHASLWKHFQAKEYQQAIEKGQELLKQHESGEGHYVIALSLEQLKRDLEAAHRHLDRALELGFDEFWVRMHRGSVKQVLGDPQGAEKDFVRAIQLQPDNRSARDAIHSMQYASLWKHFQAKEYQQAIEKGQELLKQYESGEGHYVIALSLEQLSRDLETARRHLDRALELGFDEFWVRMHRGHLRQTIGDYNGSRADFERAIELRPDDASARAALVSVREAPLWRQFNAGEFENLVRDGRVLLNRQETGAIHYLLAHSLQNLNIDLPEALGHYTRTLEFGFDEFWVRVHRGRLYYALGNEQAAEADFARAAEIQPEEAGAKAALNSARLSPVWRKFNAGQYEVVAREGRDLLRLQDSPEVRYLVAHSLHSLHIDLAEALRHYDRALELGFNEFWVRVHRGRLRRTLGDEAGAKADFSRAAELQPDERSAREAFASATEVVVIG